MAFPTNNNSSADTDSFDEFLEYYGQADSELPPAADVEPSKGLESPPPADPNINNRASASGSKINGETEEIRKLFECPICSEIIRAPITVCKNGHFKCNSCRVHLKHCPSCSAEFTEVRNRVAEDFLEKCLVKCKYANGGCEVGLLFTELAAHYGLCHYRPLLCRECDQEIPYSQFLDHLRNEEILEPQRATEYSIRFQIEELSQTYGRVRFSYWEPTWIHAFNHDFFCFLETLDTNWWIWVGGYATPEECEKFVCSITVWNKEKGTKKEYVGKVHSIRASPHDVFSSGLCLSFLEVNLKHLMYKGGIDVQVRIDTEDRCGSSKDAKRG